MIVELLFFHRHGHLPISDAAHSFKPVSFGSNILVHVSRMRGRYRNSPYHTPSCPATPASDLNKYQFCRVRNSSPSRHEPCFPPRYDHGPGPALSPCRPLYVSSWTTECPPLSRKLLHPSCGRCTCFEIVSRGRHPKVTVWSRGGGG